RRARHRGRRGASGAERAHHRVQRRPGPGGRGPGRAPRLRRPPGRRHTPEDGRAPRRARPSYRRGMDTWSLREVALDCPEPRELAEWYRAVTGWDYHPGHETTDPEGEEWLRLVPPG